MGGRTWKYWASSGPVFFTVTSKVTSYVQEPTTGISLYCVPDLRIQVFGTRTGPSMWQTGRYNETGKLCLWKK